MSCRLVGVALAALVCVASGCIEDDQFISPVYDTCITVNDCVIAATLCEELSVDFGGQFFTNAICTLECGTVGRESPDCPRTVVLAVPGSCYPSEVGGGPDDLPICFETCEVDGDCLFGFRCLGAAELCANDPNCPIVDDDRICVPGPR
ncbi:MAG: hypothetical protein AAGF92_24355 [Myxococcota bacterium]